MDALKLMQGDHKRLKALLNKAAEAEEAAKREKLLAEIRAELAAHEVMEEKIFYPALRLHEQARDLVAEGYEEHHLADIILDELMEVGAGSEIWKAKMKVLKEGIEHHIEEEEGEMFKTARKVLERKQLENLGQRMAELKEG